jgi:hypothetical protein
MAFFLISRLRNHVLNSYQTYEKIVTCVSGVCDCRRGLDWWMYLLYTLLGTTRKYSAIANLNTLKIFTGTAKTFSSLLCLHQPFPDNDSNSEGSSASRAQVLPSQTPV